MAPVRLLALAGFATHQLAYMLDSLVRVSRRADWTPSASILGARIERELDWGAPRVLGRPGGMAGVFVPRCCPSRSTHADQPRVGSEGGVAPPHVALGAPTASNRFPLNNFKHF